MLSASGSNERGTGNDEAFSIHSSTVGPSEDPLQDATTISSAPSAQFQSFRDCGPATSSSAETLSNSLNLEGLQQDLKNLRSDFATLTSATSSCAASVTRIESFIQKGIQGISQNLMSTNSTLQGHINKTSQQFSKLQEYVHRSDERILEQAKDASLQQLQGRIDEMHKMAQLPIEDQQAFQDLDMSVTTIRLRVSDVEDSVRVLQEREQQKEGSASNLGDERANNIGDELKRRIQSIERNYATIGIIQDDIDHLRSELHGSRGRGEGKGRGRSDGS